MNIYFVRTSIWRLNRSFAHIADAKRYLKQLNNQRHYKNIEKILLLNGNRI